MAPDPIEVLREGSAQWENADPKTFSGRARIKRMGGAGADAPTTHVAINVDAETTWLEPAPPA